MKSAPLAVGLVVVAVVFLVVAALYATGTLQLFASTSGVHIKHAILFAVLAVASLIAANFTRPKTA
ncbi:MAG: hypothetical protein QOJ10_1096 [Chloroflexota bacterium]|nr:hypothetical protein [Chloroflexota bacterium]